MRKKILVVSHERSGTHFLINTIAQCFDYDPVQIDLCNSEAVNWRHPDQAREWMTRFIGRPEKRIFKSHHAYPLLAPLLPEFCEDFHIFYVQRDGRDVMTSFWNYLRKLRPGWGPQTPTVELFMRATSFGGNTQYQATPYGTTMLERWIQHVEGWTVQQSPAYVVTYEALHTHYHDVVDNISKVLAQPADLKPPPSLSARSSLPWRGQVGTWKEFFTENGIEYFERNTARLRLRQGS